MKRASARADAADFQALLDPYASRAGLLIGVSGGPDSMALLMLALRWADAPGRPKIFSATVDHGLRPESRAEAEAVARWSMALGASHRLLTWEGEKPSTRLQERAREARYALLDAHARGIGADTLLTAHHADDQAETILFRLLRGSGVAGLAGMARETRRGALFHGRPLLDTPKADLIAFCDAARQAYVRDPSNGDPRFARARMRLLIAELEREGLGRDNLLRLGARAARAEQALSAMAEAVSGGLQAERRAGLFKADIRMLRESPREALVRVLSSEVERVGGGRAPRFDRVEALAGRLAEALGTGEGLRASLGGTLARLDPDGVLTITPEGPRGSKVPVKTPIEPEEKAISLHAVDKIRGASSETRPCSLGKSNHEA